MPAVRKLTEPHEKMVAAALEAIAKKNRRGRIPSLLFIAEEVGNPRPLFGMVGRFRADPSRAIGHLAVMKRKVIELAAADAPEIEDAKDA